MKIPIDAFENNLIYPGFKPESESPILAFNKIKWNFAVQDLQDTSYIVVDSFTFLRNIDDQEIFMETL